ARVAQDEGGVALEGARSAAAGQSGGGHPRVEVVAVARIVGEADVGEVRRHDGRRERSGAVRVHDGVRARVVELADRELDVREPWARRALEEERRYLLDVRTRHRIRA